MENEVNFPQKKNTPVNAGFGRFHRRIAEKMTFFVGFPQWQLFAVPVHGV